MQVPVCAAMLRQHLSQTAPGARGRDKVALTGVQDARTRNENQLVPILGVLTGGAAVAGNSSLLRTCAAASATRLQSITFHSWRRRRPWAVRLRRDFRRGVSWGVLLPRQLKKKRARSG